LDVTFRLFPYAAKEMTAIAPKPFVLRDVHKKIKHAFDPASILSMRLSLLTYETMNTPAVAEKAAPQANQEFSKNIGDRFWGG
jgi:hypothetical protein